MTVCFVLDDAAGMMFNRRRQSRDSVLCERLLALAGEKPLYVDPYSASLFPPDRIVAHEHFLRKAKKDSTVFLETVDPATVVKKGDRLVVFRWNRAYPTDLVCTLPLAQLTPMRVGEFVGSSHEKITEEEYQL